ncbi:MAG: glycosyltransferase family 2 protein [Methanobacteriota archaeon]
MTVKYSIVVPVYNEEGVIARFLEDLKKFLKTSKLDAEIIVVDDGSSDNSSREAAKSGLNIITHPYNKGYGAALKTGIRAASGRFIVTIDGDGQHRPEDILKLVEGAGKYDMIVGARLSDKGATFSRKVAKRILRALATYLSESDILDLNSGFRVIRRSLLMKYLDYLPNAFSFTTTITVICVKSGFNMKYVPIEVEKRVGKSKIDPLADFTRFIILIIRTTMLFTPLKVFLPISLVLGVLGLIDLSYGLATSFDIFDSSVFLITTSILIFFFGFLSDQISTLRRVRE